MSLNAFLLRLLEIDSAGTVFAYGVTSSGKTHTMHVSNRTLPYPPQSISCIFYRC